MDSTSSSPSIGFPTTTSSSPSSQNAFLPDHQNVAAEHKSPNFSSLLPSPQSIDGHNKLPTNCFGQHERSMGRRHFQPPPSPPFVISISSPIPLNSLKLRGNQQNMKTHFGKKFGNEKSRKCFCAIVAWILLSAIILANLTIGYWLWIRLDKLESAQKEANDLHILELESIKSKLNWSINLNGQLRGEIASKEAELKKEMAKLEEKQKVISMAFSTSSIFSVALQKISENGSIPINSINSTVPPPTKTTTQNYGDFVIYVNGKPRSGREFMANPQMQGNGQK